MDKDGNRSINDQQIIDSKNDNLLHIPKLNLCKNKCKVLGCDSHGNTDKNKMFHYKEQYCPIFQEQLKKGFCSKIFFHSKLFITYYLKEREKKANQIVREHYVKNDSEELSFMDELNDTVFEESTTVHLKPELNPSSRLSKKKNLIECKKRCLNKKLFHLAKPKDKFKISVNASNLIVKIYQKIKSRQRILHKISEKEKAAELKEENNKGLTIKEFPHSNIFCEVTNPNFETFNLTNEQLCHGYFDSDYKELQTKHKNDFKIIYNEICNHINSILFSLNDFVPNNKFNRKTKDLNFLNENEPVINQIIQFLIENINTLFDALCFNNQSEQEFENKDLIIKE